jgi:uncharacterized LabA/DUF88 family protein
MFELSLNETEFKRDIQHRELIDTTKPLKHTMAFIDGGYLRSLCKTLYDTDNINFRKVTSMIRTGFSACYERQFQLDLIRIYYYDAIVEATHSGYKAQREYFEAIHDDASLYVVKLGNLVESPKVGFRQKGVDILMATDVLTKAYRNQYDTGIFLMGDRDFVPLIEAVNDAGKGTICIHYPPNTSRELLRGFDMSRGLEKSDIKWLLEK